MKNYKYHRIEVLATQLGKAGIKQEIIDKIMEGGEKQLKQSSLIHVATGLPTRSACRI